MAGTQVDRGENVRGRLLEGGTDLPALQRLRGSVVILHAAGCLSFTGEHQATELSHLSKERGREEESVERERKREGV